MKVLSTLIFCALLPGIMFLCGCGGSKEVQHETKFVWPAPPDEARIQYVKSLTGEKDYPGALNTILKTIAGEQQHFQLNRPIDVCIEGSKIYVTDATMGVIVFDTANQKVYPLAEKSTINLGKARGIGSGHGKIFIGLANLGQIAVFNTNDSLLALIGTEQAFPNPIDVVCDTPRNRIIIVDNTWHKLFIYSETGDSLMTIGKRGEGKGEFNYPQSAAVDSAGNIYIADGFNYRVEIFDVNGTYQRSFGKQGNVWGMFERMKGIALDSYNNIYVLDGGHQNYQIFNNEGKLLMAVGTLSEDNNGFQNPVSLYIDRTNTIYVTDQLNSRVQVFHLIKGN